MNYLNEFFDYDLYIPKDGKGTEDELCVEWLPMKHTRGVFCKIGSTPFGHKAVIKEGDLKRLNFLTRKDLFGFQQITSICLRQDPIFINKRFGLTVILIPNYANFRMCVRHDLEPVPINGKYISAIAFGDNTKFSFVLPVASSRCLVEMYAIEY